MHLLFRISLMTLALVVYIALSHYLLVAPCCQAVVLPDGVPLGFTWNQTEPLMGANAEDYVKKLSTDLNPNQTLVVTGLYYAAEEIPTGFPNAGFARAGRIAALLGEKVTPDRIELRARLVAESPDTRNVPFPGFLAEVRDAAGLATQTIEELDDRIIIRFPYGSAEKDYDPQVDRFVEELARKIKESGDQILITGHADNTGTPAFNQELSRARAEGIFQLFLSQGVPADQLLVEAKGDTQPIATNETDRGRYNNRRVEVQWIK